MSDQEPDIEALFPELKSILSDWEGHGGTNGLAAPLVPGVNMEDFDGLAPPAAPFANTPSGPPPVGGVEDSSVPGQGSGESTTSPPEPPPVSTPPPADTTPPAEPTEPTTEPATEPAPDFSNLSDVELEQLVGLRDELQTDSDLRSLIANYYVNRQIGGQPPDVSQAPPAQPAAPAAFVPPPAAPAPQTPVLPDGLDLDDPAIRALYQLNQANTAQLQQLTNYVQSQAEQTRASQMAQSGSLVRRAAESFRQQHNLEEADMNKLANIAGSLQLIPRFMSGTDPMTGVPVRPDPLDAVNRALEIAYYATPEYRDRESLAKQQAQRENHQRRQRLAAVQGSSGSVPRVQPPQPGQTRRDQMIQEVAQMFDGTFTSPE